MGRRTRVALTLVAVILLVMLAPSAGRSHGLLVGPTVCGPYEAPAVTECGDVHASALGAYVYGFAPVYGQYHGTLVIELTWSALFFRFTCHYTGDALTDLPADLTGANCSEFGIAPPPGSVFEHSCYSYDLKTTTPGGSGTWSCFIVHV